MQKLYFKGYQYRFEIFLATFSKFRIYSCLQLFVRLVKLSLSGNKRTDKGFQTVSYRSRKVISVLVVWKFNCFGNYSTGLFLLLCCSKVCIQSVFPCDGASWRNFARFLIRNISTNGVMSRSCSVRWAVHYSCEDILTVFPCLI